MGHPTIRRLFDVAKLLIHAESEPPGVYQALVGDLARTHVPTSIMGITFVGTGSYAYALTGSKCILAAVLYGGLATTTRLVLMSAYQRREAQGRVIPSYIARWEAGHAATVISVAASVGLLCSVIFFQPSLPLQMLATALIFGYCAGIVSRVAIRPRIAIAALTIAAVPSIVAASSWLESTHTMIAVIFSVFLLGSYDSVRHVYRTAVRHIQTQLDMAALARLDPLTNLPNRLGLQNSFKSMVVSRTGSLALHYFDLDGFKAVNDNFGHATGDALLAALAHRLRVLLPAGAIASRIGGDEFVVLQLITSQSGDEDLLARSLCSAVSEPYYLLGQEIRIGVSLGYVRTHTSSADLSELLRLADEASYSVKRAGGGLARADT